jgi:branched-chain amino acid transport system ATP-binding protein
MSVTPELRVSGLTVTYGGLHAVDGLDLEVHKGEVVSILGANGAGKSSTCRAVIGLVRSSGSVELVGRRLERQPAHVRAAAGIGFVPEGRHVVAPLTVLENLQLGGYRCSREDRREGLNRVHALFPILRERGNQASGMLSGGEQQMLAIGRALMSRPKVLVLDEPSMGLAPAIVKLVFESLVEVAATGVAVLVAEQNTGRVTAVADRVYLLRLGEVVAAGPASDFNDAAEVARLYFGG